MEMLRFKLLNMNIYYIYLSQGTFDCNKMLKFIPTETMYRYLGCQFCWAAWVLIISTTFTAPALVFGRVPGNANQSGDGQEEIFAFSKKTVGLIHQNSGESSNQCSCGCIQCGAAPTNKTVKRSIDTCPPPASISKTLHKAIEIFPGQFTTWEQAKKECDKHEMKMFSISNDADITLLREHQTVVDKKEAFKSNPLVWIASKIVKISDSHPCWLDGGNVPEDPRKWDSQGLPSTVGCLQLHVDEEEFGKFHWDKTCVSKPIPVSICEKFVESAPDVAKVSADANVTASSGNTPQSTTEDSLDDDEDIVEYDEPTNETSSASSQSKECSIAIKRLLRANVFKNKTRAYVGLIAQKINELKRALNSGKPTRAYRRNFKVGLTILKKTADSTYKLSAEAVSAAERHQKEACKKKTAATSRVSLPKQSSEKYEPCAVKLEENAKLIQKQKQQLKDEIVATNAQVADFNSHIGEQNMKIALILKDVIKACHMATNVTNDLEIHISKVLYSGHKKSAPNDSRRHVILKESDHWIRTKTNFEEIDKTIVKMKSLEKLLCEKIVNSTRMLTMDSIATDGRDEDREGTITLDSDEIDVVACEKATNLTTQLNETAAKARSTAKYRESLLNDTIANVTVSQKALDAAITQEKLEISDTRARKDSMQRTVKALEEKVLECQKEFANVTMAMDRAYDSSKKTNNKRTKMITIKLIRKSIEIEVRCNEAKSKLNSTISASRASPSAGASVGLVAAATKNLQQANTKFQEAGLTYDKYSNLAFKAKRRATEANERQNRICSHTTQFVIKFDTRR